LDNLTLNPERRTICLPVPAALPPHLAHLECVECGLSGSLPPLPPSLRRLDLSDNNLVGEIDGLDLTHMQVGGEHMCVCGGGGSVCVVLCV